MRWVIKARGHPNVTARHRNTFMVTKDAEVGPNGDCIIGVGADRACLDLDPALKRLLASGAPVAITLSAGKYAEKIRAKGHPSLNLDHPHDIVVRKSGFACGRTLAVGADKAAADLARGLAAALRDPETELEMEIASGDEDGRPVARPGRKAP